MDRKSLGTLPDDLPIPVDDGACDHLPGQRLPAIALPATTGGPVDLSQLPPSTVIYAYPRTGLPDEPLPDGWDAIPGARGCTPQACDFRDHRSELSALGANVYALSTQDTAYQQEMAERLHLPFPVLSDANLALVKALRLPTFDVEIKGRAATLIKRLTLIIRDGVIEKVFYPVFPPDGHARTVITYLRENAE